MQSQNIKIIRTKDNSLFIFYYNNGEISYSSIQNGKFSPRQTLMENVSPSFSLYCSDTGIYLLAKGTQGIILCYNDSRRWVSKLISKETDISKMAFFVFGNKVHLLYSTQSPNAETQSLFARSMADDNWMTPVKIADILPFNTTSFFTGMRSDSKVNIYFRLSDKTLIYTTLNLENSQLDEKRNLLSTNMPCIDISILTNKNEIHILYLAETMYSLQLIYKSIGTNPQVKATIIWEGQLLENCSLFCHNGMYHALIYNNSKLFQISSNNPSEGFSLPRSLECEIPTIKGEYLDFSSDTSFIADEILVNLETNTFPIINDMVDSFIPTIRNQSTTSKIETIIKEQTLKASTDYQLQIKTLSEQISQLSTTLTKRNDELATTSARWQKRYDALEKENSFLKQKLTEFETNTLPSNLLASENNSIKQISEKESLMISDDNIIDGDYREH